jgi:hypothetical protein
MPIYNYECECGNAFEEFMHIPEYRRKKGRYYKCPKCGKMAEQVYGTPAHNVHSVTRVSMSLGMHPDQIADGTAARIHPGAEFDGQGNMITKSLHERRQRMKERGRATDTTWSETS